MSDPIYYHITGGPVLKSIEKFQTFYREETARQGDICKQFGAISVWGNSSGISGLLFEKDAKPKGWVKASKSRSDVFKPNERTSDGKAQMEILRSGCVPDAHKFQEIVTGVDNVFMFLAKNDLRVRVLGYELIGGNHVLHYPNPEGGFSIQGKRWEVPEEGTRLLKQSEYWAMKESAENSLDKTK